MRAAENFCAIPRGERLHQDEGRANDPQQQLHVTEAGHQQAGDANAVPAVDDNDEVRSHVDQRPRHTDHVHVVEVELDVGGGDSCGELGTLSCKQRVQASLRW